MKNYQKPDLEYVVLTTTEEIANSNTGDLDAIGGITNNPFGGTSPVSCSYTVD